MIFTYIDKVILKFTWLIKKEENSEKKIVVGGLVLFCFNHFTKIWYLKHCGIYTKNGLDNKTDKPKKRSFYVNDKECTTN